MGHYDVRVVWKATGLWHCSLEGGEWQQEHANALKHHSEMTPQNITVTSRCYWCSCGAGGPSYGYISVKPSQQAELCIEKCFYFLCECQRREKLMFNTLEMAC